MAQIQILSDVHLEHQFPKAYGTFDIAPRAPYLALLGDIGNAGAVEHRQGLQRFLTRQMRQFKAVLYVPGNHEAYGSSWPTTLSVLRVFEEETAAQRRNDAALGEFVLMDRATFRIPGQAPNQGATVLLGCSLFSCVPPVAQARVRRSLNDFYMTADEWDVDAHNAAHTRDLAWLNEQAALAEGDPAVDVVAILTHWSPSLDDGAVEPIHQGSAVQSAFCTDLSAEPCWLAEKVRVWACVHTHFNFDVKLDRGEGRRPIRLVSNQRGYHFEQSPGYDEEKVIEI